MHGPGRLTRLATALAASALTVLPVLTAAPAWAADQVVLDVMKMVDGEYVVETVTVPAGTVAATVERLEASPGVVAAGPAVTYEVTAPDPLWEADDPAAASNVRAAWTRTRGAGQVVAVLDTARDVTHPDLAGAVFPGTDVVGGTDTSHGMGVAGVVAARADNGIGSAGMAPEAKVMPIKVCDGTCPSDSIARGILWAADHGADVINMSLSGGYSDVTATAVQYALDKNISVVASAGNDGSGTNAVMYPAALSGVIGVSATGPTGAPAAWAQHGWQVDVSTVGESVLLAMPGGGYGWGSGTSFSGPAVAGAVALIRASHPGIGITDIQAALQAGVQSSTWDRAWGAGCLDVPAALEAADRISGGVTVAPGAQTLDISWAAVAGATDYTVRVDGSVRATVTGTSTQLTGLTNGNQLAVDVQPSNGDRSRPLLATVGPAAPGTPTLISGALRGTSTSAVLDLNASVAGAPAPRYAILRDGVSIGTVDMGLSATPTTTAIGIGAMPTVETHWQIRGVDDLGRSSGASNAITVGTGRPAPPAGVTGLGAQLADDQALLIWDDLGTAYTYRVSVAGAVVASPHSAGAVLPAPAAGESRTYTVVAVDAWGQNGPAATTTFRRPGKPELTVEPSVVGATVAGRTVSTPDAFTGADTVTHAWRACDADGCVPVAGDVTHLITAAEVGKRLTVEATATNAVGVTTAVSPQSAVVSAADVAAPVELAVVQRLAAGGMNLWQLPLAEGHPAFGTPDLVRSLDHGGFSYDRSRLLSGDVADVTASDDGSPDQLIWHAGGNGGALLWAVGGGSDSTPKLWHDLRTGGWSYANSDPMVGDVTGDGWDDLVVRHASSAGDALLWVFPSDGARVGAPQRWGRTLGLAHRALLADVDADGREDLVLARPATSAGTGLAYDVQRANGSGTGFAAARTTIFAGTPAAGWSFRSSRQLAGDVTGDGLADLVTVHASTANGGLLVWVQRNCSAGGTPVCFQRPTLWQDLRTGGWSYARSRQHLADTDGDGRADLISVHGSPASPGFLVWRHRSSSTALLAPQNIVDLRVGGWRYAGSRSTVG